MQASGCGSRRNQFEISRKKRIHQESSIECTKIIINYDLRAVMQNKKNENCANDVKRLPGDEKNFRIFLFFFRVHARSHDSNLLKRDSRHIRAQAASGDGGANAENISFLRFYLQRKRMRTETHTHKFTNLFAAVLASSHSSNSL